MSIFNNKDKTDAKPVLTTPSSPVEINKSKTHEEKTHDKQAHDKEAKTELKNEGEKVTPAPKPKDEYIVTPAPKENI